MKKVFLYLTLLASLNACTSQTLIRTDENVRIYIDEQYYGMGEVKYSDRQISGSKVYVELKKTGCRDDVRSFTRNEEFDTWAIVGGIFLVPLLWVKKYKPEREMDFVCRPDL